MGFFSNGTEAQMYEEKYCAKCLHGRDEEPCAVLNAHFIAATEDGWADDTSSIRMVLDMFIPLDEEHWNQECKMIRRIPAHLDVDWDEMMADYLKDVINADSEEVVVLRESREPKPVPCERGRR